MQRKEFSVLLCPVTVHLHRSYQLTSAVGVVQLHWHLVMPHFHPFWAKQHVHFIFLRAIWFIPLPTSSKNCLTGSFCLFFPFHTLLPQSVKFLVILTINFVSKIYSWWSLQKHKFLSDSFPHFVYLHQFVMLWTGVVKLCSSPASILVLLPKQNCSDHIPFQQLLVKSALISE